MTSVLGGFRRRGIIRQLERVFENSEASSGLSLPIQKTGRGIWAATPVRVVAEAVTLLGDLGVLEQQGQDGCAIDAGAGDGRVLAVLASLHPSLVIYGIEADSTLHARAATTLSTLTTSGLIDSARVHLLEADYCDVSTYEARGIVLESGPLIFNYPDGNEKRLARFVADHCGKATTLCLLTHNRSLEIDELELSVRHDVSDGAETPWRLSLYQRQSSLATGS